jgi:RNA polymerase sigma factor (sigma-70 family)
MQGHNMDRGTDAELVTAARKGDLDAFTTLVGRYREPALRVAYGIAGGEAEDAVQNAFVKAYRSLDGFRVDAAFRPWLFTIVANESRNSRRSWSRRNRLDLQVRREPQLAGEAADQVAAVHEQRQRILDEVARLPDRYREVVALRYFAGLSEIETADVLSCPRGTAKSRLSRALDMLRVALGEEVTL